MVSIHPVPDQVSVSQGVFEALTELQIAHRELATARATLEEAENRFTNIAERLARKQKLSELMAEPA